MTRGLTILFAFCCGAIVANIYYAQTIIGLIAPDLGLSPVSASLIVSLTQIGYALGLFFVVPLGDLVENRRLLVVSTATSIVALGAAALTRSADVFLLMSFLIGFSSVSVQILVPLAANLADPAARGRVVGNIMGGLITGILLTRPVASFAADHFGWRAVFSGAAVVMAAISLLLATRVPRRQPAHQASYAALLRSLGTLVARQPVLRRRSLYQACMFASFTLFWTAVPLELAQRYGLSHSQIALFALIGAMGAIAAPISGRIADAGHSRVASLAALAIGVLGYAPSLAQPWGVLGLCVTAVVLDFCVQMHMVLGQREIYALDSASRNRLNALYMTSIFIGAASGSALASPLYSRFGWPGVAVAGSLFPLLALGRFLLAQRARNN